MQETLAEDQNAPPTLMDQIYKRQRFIYDASRKYYLLGRDELIKSLQIPENGTGLELGCGTGRNLICAAKVYKSATLYGIDISSEMLKTAGSSIYKANLEHRLNLAKGDAITINTQSAFAIPSFDRVFISFSLSMIPNWQAALTHGLSLVKPGGELHIIDFGECDKLPNPFKAMLYKWLELFHVRPIPNMSQWVSEIAENNGGTAVSKPLYSGYSFYASIKKPL